VQLVHGIVFGLMLLSPREDAPAKPEVERDSTPLGMPYERYVTKDQFGRRITFYLSPAGKASERQPLALIVLGSGCQSAFRKLGDKVGGGFQNLLLEVGRGRVRVLVVEKPGVKYLDHPQRPGTALGASREFLEEHTLPRWAEANRAAVHAALSLPGVDPQRVLAVGHSEGAIAAARVAAEDHRVTHVASLSGGGPTQLFSLVELVRGGHTGGTPKPAAQADDEVYAEWAKVQADPDSVTKFWMSHPYRRWSSFLKSSVTEELLRSRARVYLAQGTRDTSSPVAGFDVLRAELVARGRDVTAERLEGADHGFRREGDGPGPEGMKAVLGRVVEWFLSPKP
jgi:dienelactone hydrolase